MSPPIYSLERSIDGGFTFTTDIWSSRATQGYITLTVHWISEDWELESKVMFTTEMTERNTAVNIAERLSQSCVHWGIRDQHVVAIVHDNASNLFAAVQNRT